MSKKDDNKLERESIEVSDLRVWKHQQNLSGEDIISNVIDNQAKIKNLQKL